MSCEILCLSTDGENVILFSARNKLQRLQYLKQEGLTPLCADQKELRGYVRLGAIPVVAMIAYRDVL